jgi:hypothetical protein
MSQQQDNINLVHDIDAMQEFIRKYATKNWQLPENIALKEIPEQLHKQGCVFNQELAVELFKALDKALYGRGVGSLDELKFKWKIFSKEVIITKNKQGKVNNTFGDLNPT